MYGEATSYQDIANEHVLVIPMIETREAIANIDEILDVPGVSGIYVGPSDLAFSLGRKPSMDREEPDILEIYEMLVQATNKRGQFAGVHTGKPEYTARMIDMGFRLVTIANDASLLAKALRDAIRIARDEARNFRTAFPKTTNTGQVLGLRLVQSRSAGRSCYRATNNPICDLGKPCQPPKTQKAITP